MAVQRSRRLRKKLHLDEFQELGFSVSWSFAAGTSTEQIDSTVDAFIAEVIESQGLGYAGGGYLHWEGLVCPLTKKCTDEHRSAVETWLTQRGLENIQVSPLFDVWWD